ncbi:MAG: pimeloyl-ACP methyl ester carboxylesterase [Patiriisocius sp.]|jgi:pimeloyl-ACP methyl ester carboxylesterase
MNTITTHVYFVPGLAADKEIFRNIKLPVSHYTMHVISWLIPHKKEPIANYAERMAAFVNHEDAVLVGVSFGGVIVQEMSAFLALKKLIIISSVKSKHELPRRLRIAQKTRAYKMVPTGLVLQSKDLTKYAIGPRSKKRLKLYQDFLHVRDKRYLDWAIKNMICWQRDSPLSSVYHVHGDDDLIFPIENIQEALIIPGGTHIMLLNKGSLVTQKLVDIIAIK